MTTPIIGMGTIVNVLAILIGSSIGMALGDRLGERTRTTITEVLGILTIVMAATSIEALWSPDLRDAVGSAALVIVMAATLIGTWIGSVARLDDRFLAFGDWFRHVLTRGRASDDAQARQRFVNGFVTASLVFCVGPLAILGSLNDGLGNGAEQLYMKSTLDFFSSMAFAASLGIGVTASIAAVIVIQGGFTAVGFFIGDVLPTAAVDGLSVAGGVILVGLGIKLLGLKDIRITDMLPALVLAPLFVVGVAAI